MDTCEAGNSVEETRNSEIYFQIQETHPTKTNKKQNTNNNKKTAVYFGSSVKHSYTSQREYLQSGDCSYLHIYIRQV